MLIECNLPGGFQLFGVRLVYGENFVEDDLWAATVARLDPRFYNGLIRQPGGNMPPYLVIKTDAETKPEPEPEAPPVLQLAPDPPPEPEAAPKMSAKDKIALVQAATTYEQLNQLEDGEHRKTVLTAIYAQAEKIDREAAKQ